MINPIAIALTHTFRDNHPIFFHRADISGRSVPCFDTANTYFIQNENSPSEDATHTRNTSPAVNCKAIMLLEQTSKPFPQPLGRIHSSILRCQPNAAYTLTTQSEFTIYLNIRIPIALISNTKTSPSNGPF